MSKRVALIGIDDGHDGIKIYMGVNPVSKEPMEFKMLSRATIGRVNMGDEDTIQRELINVDGDIFTVSENLHNFENTRLSDYPISKLNKALVYQALRLASPDIKIIKIASGLPVNRFYNTQQNTMNNELIKSKKLNLLNMKGVFNEFDKSHGIEQIVIKDHIVLCEANAAYYDVLLDDSDEDGPDISEIAKKYEIQDYGAAVIDIGGKTTDCVVVNPGGATLNGHRSGTIDVGVLNLLDDLRADLKSTYGWSFISEPALKKAVLSGKYGVGENQKDISDILMKHKEALFKKIENHISTTVGDASDVPAIILVGGGSYLIGDLVRERYHNIITPTNPEFSNARGFYKIYKYILGGDDE